MNYFYKIYQNKWILNLLKIIKVRLAKQIKIVLQQNRHI